MMSLTACDVIVQIQYQQNIIAAPIRSGQAQAMCLDGLTMKSPSDAAAVAAAVAVAETGKQACICQF